MSEIHSQVLPEGYRLQDYRIDRVLGEGGFGVTYLATDVILGKQLAIKEYLPVEFAVRGNEYSVTARSEASRDIFAWGLERFLDEARRLVPFQDHPNIVRVERFFEAHGTAYMVMAFQEGESFDALLRREGPLDEGRLRAILEPLLSGLEAIHRADLLHRDIKPDNIFIRRDGSPMLLDFGAARESLGQRSCSMTGIIAEGYSPLEQYSAEGGKQGRWTDLYALGATLYRAITGERPPPATDRVIGDALVPISEVAAGQYDQSLLAAIDATLAVMPELRPQSIAEFRTAIVGDQKPPKPPSIPPEVRPPIERPGPDLPSDFESIQGLADAGNPEAQVRLGVIYFNGEGVDVDLAQTVHWFRLAAEQNFADGLNWLGRLYDEGDGVAEDDAEAARLYRLAAEQGLTIAQHNLAMMLLNGEGVPEDRSEAAHWFRLAAEQGHVDAQFSLGLRLLDGDGVVEDETEAAHWFRQAADQEHAEARNRLGLMYDGGMGVDQSDSEALHWYRLAADQGYAAAQCNLGIMYATGQGVGEDNTEAARWYHLAADQGNADAQNRLGLLYDEGQGVDEDDVAAVAWYRLAADQDHPSAQYNLGLMYENGEGVDEDRAEALRWIRRAADQGHEDARDKLANLGDVEPIDPFGDEVPTDDRQAIAWFLERADQGDAAAQFELAELHELGVRTPKNEREAIRWYTQAADQGHTQAQYNLGLMYDHGEGVEEDDAEAVRLYRRAAESGHAEAQNHLAEMYEFGWGVAEDESVALYWYRKAAEQGHDEARQSADSLDHFTAADVDDYGGDVDDDTPPPPRSSTYRLRKGLDTVIGGFVEHVIMSLFRVGGHWFLWGTIAYGLSHAYAAFAYFRDGAWDRWAMYEIIDNGEWVDTGYFYLTFTIEEFLDRYFPALYADWLVPPQSWTGLHEFSLTIIANAHMAFLIWLIGAGVIVVLAPIGAALDPDP